jgi:rubrerythrin
MGITIREILEAAIRREEDAQAFYTRVAAACANASVRQLFIQLASDEQGHKLFLTGCLQDPALLQKLPLPPDYKVAEAAQRPEPHAALSPADAIALAMKREQGAVEHYRQLAAMATAPDYKQAFEGLAAMELGHKTKLESAFVNIGYPEAF